MSPLVLPFPKRIKRLAKNKCRLGGDGAFIFAAQMINFLLRAARPVTAGRRTAAMCRPGEGCCHDRRCSCARTALQDGGLLVMWPISKHGLGYSRTGYGLYRSAMVNPRWSNFLWLELLRVCHGGRVVHSPLQLVERTSQLGIVTLPCSGIHLDRLGESYVAALSFSDRDLLG